jgi:hypothetical protein
MKKIRLDLDALAVESFPTHAPEDAGTVIAAAAIGGAAPGTYPNCSAIDACPSAWNCTLNGTCYDPTCAQANTCWKTCVATCPNTCANTCQQSCYVPACSGPVCAA